MLFAIIYIVCFGLALMEILYANWSHHANDRASDRTGIAEDRTSALAMNILTAFAVIAVGYTYEAILDERVEKGVALVALLVGFHGFVLRHFVDLYRTITLQPKGEHAIAYWGSSLMQQFVTIFVALGMGFHAYTSK